MFPTNCLIGYRININKIDKQATRLYIKIINAFKTDLRKMGKAEKMPSFVTNQLNN